MKRPILATLLSLFILSAIAHAEKGVSAGLNLLQAPSARAAGLGEAFTAVDDDISGLAYNPAAISSLERGQASFLFYRGLMDDSFGQFLIGTPTKNGGVGLSVGYYDGGKLELFDGADTRSVTAKSDLIAAAGLARNMGPLSVGITGKYISSKLADTYSANAVAADIGMGMKFSKQWRIGIAAQNFGTQLKFDKEGDDLPRIARVGLSKKAQWGRVPMMLLLDAPYYLNEKEIHPAVGIETGMGPLALRAGYKSGNDLGGLSMGAGFQIASAMIDYSFGLMDKLDSQHRVSFSMRFGDAPSKE